jgi:hypothetical protein
MRGLEMAKPKRSAATSGARTKPTRFLLFIYRMPAKPTAARVGVWRHLKKIGAIYLQQSVCVFPDNAHIRREMRPIIGRIDEAGGEYHLLALRQPSPPETQKLLQQFVAETSRRYQEIIENCEVNFQKEIEFETFRKNFTYEEAEEIRNEFEKIVNWFNEVEERDWFNAPNRAEAADWLKRCESLLEEFEGRVYEIQEKTTGSEEPSASARRASGVRLVPSV